MFKRISQLWCKKMHSRTMWPIHGRYVCPKCLREYPVSWEAYEAALPAPSARRQYANPVSK